MEIGLGLGLELELGLVLGLELALALEFRFESRLGLGLGLKLRRFPWPHRFQSFYGHIGSNCSMVTFAVSGFCPGSGFDQRANRIPRKLGSGSW